MNARRRYIEVRKEIQRVDREEAERMEREELWRSCREENWVSDAQRALEEVEAIRAARDADFRYRALRAELDI